MFVFFRRVSLAALIIVFAGMVVSAELPEPRWFKGNLHTHSLWSDGDQFPEMISDWYVQHGYNFLALTDHNILSQGQKWIPVATAEKRGSKTVLQEYRARFGDAWVQTRGDAGTAKHEVRLKPLNEFRHLVEQSGEFMLIQSEEISDRAEGKPLHINAANVAEKIEPAGGATMGEAIHNNLRALIAHELEHGREILPHLNHPNFHYAVTAQELGMATAERFYEVYNGHPGVNHLGDKDHPGVESIWDLVNELRVRHLASPPIMGIATDDSHEYHGLPGSRPGRGWVMVRSRYLTPDHIIAAMKRGDFYASSGVSLSDVQFDSESRTLSVEIATEPGVTYETTFVATLKPDPAAKEANASAGLTGTPAVVTKSTSESPVQTYQLADGESCVRAVVTSSKDHPDPSYKSQKTQAWTQPAGWQPSKK